VPHRVLGHAEQRGKGRQVRRQSDYRADVEIPVGPTVEPMANAARAWIRHDCSEAKRRIGIIDRRVTKSALNAHRLKLAGRTEHSGSADDGIQFEKRDRHGRIVEVDCSLCDLLTKAYRNGIHVDLQSDRKGSRRAHTWTHSTQTSAGNRLVWFTRPSPQGF